VICPARADFPAPNPSDTEARAKMKTPIIVLSTLAVTAVVGAVGTYAFVNSGLYDVSATTPDSRLVYWATHHTNLR
jgi:hypothetical protein